MSPARPLRHGHARLLLLAALLAFAAPVLLRGEVVFPHRNREELGLPPAPAGRPESRVFSDLSSVFVPQLHQHLNGDAAGWLSTWDPHTELGRPSLHTGGLSKAFVLTHALSWVSDDAFRVYTALALAAVAGTGLFGFELLAALGLHPAACLAGALSLALGAFVPFWLRFALFVWGICWTLALLWATTRLLERPSPLRALGLAFAVHALLLTGYPQQVVWHAWLVAGYALLRLARQPLAARARLRRALAWAGAVLAGGLSTLPVTLDLALLARRSARLGADADFFLAALPALEGAREALAFLVTSFDPLWLGSPLLEAYPARFDGVALLPLGAACALWSLLDGLPRRLWPAQAFAALTLLLALVPEAFQIGIRYAGLGLSRFDPLAAGLIPLAALAAYGADHALRNGLRQRSAALLLAGLPGPLLAAAAAGAGLPVAPGPVLAALGLAAGACAVALTRSAALLALLALAGAAHYALPLRGMRPLEEIARDSELAALLRRETGDGSRYALVGDAGLLLPSNQEQLLGLRSVHTYDSLSSRAYQAWAQRASEAGTRVYGRYFRSLASPRDLSRPALDAAGVGVWVAPGGLGPAAAGERLAALGGGGIYRARERPLLEAQLTGFEETGGALRLAGRLRELPRLPVARTLDRDDRLEFQVTPASGPTLLFVSQQHHPHWRAFAGAVELACLPVDGIFLGVLLPPGTGSVELRFLPHARHAWIPQLGFALLFAAAAAAALARRLRGRTRRASPARS